MREVFSNLSRDSFTISLYAANGCFAIGYSFSQFAQGVTALFEAYENVR